MPLVLMRRQAPRDSPNCTRVSGPMDATMRDCRVAPARTTTHLRATALAQRAFVPARAGAAFGAEGPRVATPGAGAVGRLSALGGGSGIPPPHCSVGGCD